MGPSTSSGFYVSRAVAALLAGLTAALLLALGVFAALYGHCTRVQSSEPCGHAVNCSASSAPRQPEEKPPTSTPEPAREPAVASTTSTRRPPGPWDQLRLPSWLVPLHYELELWPRLQPGDLSAESLSFTGRVNITVRCAVSTTWLLLHSLFLDCEHAEVRGPLSLDAENATVDRVPVNDVWFMLDTEYMVLELGEALQPGSRYELQLSFSGQVYQDTREGLFLNVYTDQGERRALLASQMEPTFARMVFPCFDEPALKATFNITIIHHPSYVVLSNMPTLGQTEKDVNGKKWTVTTFYTTPRMPTYLVAVAICDYDYVNRTERGKEIRIWARKDAITNGNADFALNITGPIFSFLEDLFNISYPLPKTDIIALPVFDNRAMENWGLLMFDETSLLLQPSDQLTEKKTQIYYTVSHEIGHQWFGNLVTMNWWNNIWLNEGFASYFEFGVINYINPRLPKNEIFFSNILNGVLREDHALVSRAVSKKVENFTETSEINEIFDLFTYNKGASMARMLASFLNENLFIGALKSYLETFSYSNAEQDDLWRHFQMAIDNQSKILLPATVKSIMDSWTHKSGFPVITLNVSTGMMKQEPFYLEKIKNQTLLTHNDTWIVPILWIKNGTAQPLVWLDKRSKVFPEMQSSDSDHGWVILNLNMTGYYRVNYDKLGWKKLNQQLEKDPKAIPVIHRLQLIDDAFSLSKNNYIEIETALDLTKYLAEEDEIIVWHAVLANLITRDLVSDVNNYRLYPLLKKYLLKRLNSIWNTYATIIRENIAALEDDYLAILSLETLFGTACWLGLEDCLQLSRELFRKWMHNPENEIPYPIKNEILCYGIALGNDKEWEFLFKIYTNITNEDERFQLAYALGCSKEPWILRRYMEYAITASPFNFNETNIIEVVAASSEVGRYIAKDFLVNNWQAVSERYGTQSLVTLAYIIGSSMSTDLQITELQQLFSNMLEEHQKITVHAKLQMIKNENLKIKKRSAMLAEWLQKNT
ncbi:PREDICTED: aminopeptidase Q-like [Elephantulus edwardii]|uniref:aminopeptidase Q-like n=1 Tax=Elephantulus edwardii TaxID=28737 RepID=UPI0003F0942C|nr:PREDICTED: aminopeptidase Q-like [Elephantulus edwardii]